MVVVVVVVWCSGGGVVFVQSVVWCKECCFLIGSVMTCL